MLKKIYTKIVVFILYWLIKIIHPKEDREFFVIWMGMKLGYMDEEDVEWWAQYKSRKDLNEKMRDVKWDS